LIGSSRTISSFFELRRMSLKICQLCSVDFTLKHFLLPLIDGMESRGWEVTSVCSIGPYISELRRHGYRIEPVGISRSRNPVSAIWSLFRLIRIFRREQFDVLHVHTPVAALIGRVAAWLCGIPLVIYTAHGFYFHDDMSAWKRSIYVFLERLGGQFTDLLFCQSGEDAEAAVIERIVTRDRVLKIGNGVDVKRFSPDHVDAPELTRRLLAIPNDAFVVGLIGRQVQEKGLVEFLTAVTMLAGRYPKLYVLLVGERLSSDHARSVEQELMAARDALGDRLLSLGLRDDIPNLLSVMDLFCLPSWREGMPRSIIEAMMLGKPVLATDIRGSREEVVPEVTGLIVPVKSSVAIAKAIERFLLNPDWGRLLGEEGRRRATSIYDERKIVALQLNRIEEEASLRGLTRSA
jgi:glycosyltransferase involved in cell wall biosynthesis